MNTAPYPVQTQSSCPKRERRKISPVLVGDSCFATAQLCSIYTLLLGRGENTMSKYYTIITAASLEYLPENVTGPAVLSATRRLQNAFFTSKVSPHNTMLHVSTHMVIIRCLNPLCDGNCCAYVTVVKLFWYVVRSVR